MEEMILQISKGEADKDGRTETAESSADIIGGSPMEEKMDKILEKLASMETTMTRMTGLFGGAFNGKSDE